MDDWEPRVIVGVSPSPAGLRALRMAVPEARRRGRPLYAVRAWRMDRAGGSYHRGQSAARLLIEECLDAALGGRPEGVRLHRLALLDDPGNALSRSTRDGDVLFVGRPDRSWWRGGLRRSVTGYCLAHACCPVQVVPVGSFARAAARCDLAAEVARALAGPDTGA